MTDDLISDAVVDAAERAYQTFGAGMRDALEAALPHLRAHQIEVQTRIGYELGRKETAEAIAQAIEVVNDGYLISPIRAARIAREIGGTS